MLYSSHGYVHTCIELARLEFSQKGGGGNTCEKKTWERLRNFIFFRLKWYFKSWWKLLSPWNETFISDFLAEEIPIFFVNQNGRRMHLHTLEIKQTNKCEPVHSITQLLKYESSVSFQSNYFVKSNSIWSIIGRVKGYLDQCLQSRDIRFNSVNVIIIFF